MKINNIIIKHLSGIRSNQVDKFNFDATNEITLGRSEDSMVRFDSDKEIGVSRNHATLSKGVSDLQFFIEDKNSMNGVLVNEEKISGRREIFPGDSIQLGLKGPKFVFDLDPRPVGNKATQLMQTMAATQELSSEEPLVSSPQAKQGIGKETFERAIVVERKKSMASMAAILGGLVLMIAALGFTFKDSIFPPPPPPPLPIPVDQGTTLADIVQNNMNKVVSIETGWKLIHAPTGDEIYHEYTTYTDPATKEKYNLPVFIDRGNGKVEPSLGLRKNIQNGKPIASIGTGTGFVIDKEGFIMTNKHVTSSWKMTPYSFDVRQGVLFSYVNGKWVNKGLTNSPYWIPGKSTLFGREPIVGKILTAETTFMDVVFSKTVQRINATISRESPEHDLAIIKIGSIGDLSPVDLASADYKVREGQEIMSMGFPGLSPEAKKFTKDQSYVGINNFKSAPSPTAAEGIISKILNSSQDASLTQSNDIVSAMGDYYQMTINSGGGNSGGPVFNDEGEVIAIFTAATWDNAGTKFTFSVPIKYALNLMTTQTVIK